MAQLWGGRFTKETDQLVYNFNASISFDKKFYRQDIEGSRAHVSRFWEGFTAYSGMWRMGRWKLQTPMRISTALWRQI